ncbi:hypothetical protein GOHSU_21_00020 [Gordonia hirsuta DSM 44140 = NBRC 16056]|uniref:Uncharacterized protein n=1 Tax=Gordonia hirsuta DSM 44140 = NBRC 16056 TaxID=1121927 RepID=L7L8R0_9ACTN|nr:hypothetical protein GOHSU_21_00020 [Gordonia hirsuta DSM 44140 = NBRC 16056]
MPGVCGRAYSSHNGIELVFGRSRTANKHARRRAERAANRRERLTKNNTDPTPPTDDNDPPLF